MGKLFRLYLMGYLLVGDCERFMLRLLEEVCNKLVNVNLGFLFVMISFRIGYWIRSVGCIGMGIKLDRWWFFVSLFFIFWFCLVWLFNFEGVIEGININLIGIISGLKNFFKLIRLLLN